MSEEKDTNKSTNNSETISIFKSIFTSYSGGGIKDNPTMVKQALVSIAGLLIVAGVDYMCNKGKKENDKK
jgi:hypothetical protein